ncbi:lipase family protein [Scytonema sp. NUACC26]|uniref:lipase family protein n=1 Tax=Scytonema sp. NUACC26 TaxID=3140176 RepID=UPI0038B4132A
MRFAIATLCAFHIHLSQTIQVENPILYTFASPRVGDQTFAKHFETLECYRIANSEDVVPKIPIPSLLLVSGRVPGKSGTASLATGLLGKFSNYQHIGIPIHFTAQTGNISDNHTIPIYLKALGVEVER